MSRVPFENTSEPSLAASPTTSSFPLSVSVEAVVPPSSRAATCAVAVSDTEKGVAEELLPTQTMSLEDGGLLPVQLSAVLPLSFAPRRVHESVHGANACAAVASTRSAAPKEVNAVRTRAPLAAARPKRE